MVVVGKNEERHLANCLSSLIGQDYHEFEIIYVDGDSSDSSLSIADSLKAGSSRMRIVKGGGNVSESRNLGLSFAEGEIVAFTDADCVPDRDWLRGLVSGLINCPKDVAGVGGPNVPPEESRSFRLRVIDQTLSTLLGSGTSVQTKLVGSGKFVRALSTSNCAFWRSRLQEVGGFNSKLTFCEDSDLSARLRRLGLKMLWLSSHPVRHFRDYDGMKSFVSYIGRYGRGRGEAVRQVPHLITGALGISLSVIILFIVTMLLSFLDAGAGTLLAIYLGTYFALVLMASAFVAMRLHRVSAMAVAFIVYVATHVTYLTSFLIGLLFPRNAGNHRYVATF